jgi:hypothetical protein
LLIVDVNDIVSGYWQLHAAALINMINRAEMTKNNEGVLILTPINKESGKLQNGTVCKDMFNSRSAHLFCQSIGYVFADWGTYPTNTKYAKYE